jgi:hypothetical protein
MIEFIREFGMPVISVVVLILGGMYVPAVRKVFLMIFNAILSEGVIKKVVLYFLDKLVKSTKNTLDDKILEEVKKSLG